MGKIIEGYWDCPQCGKKKIKGRFRYCDSCGRPRGKDVKFYMIETDNYVENEEEISKEPDWYCSFCKSLNPATSTVCESCGASQEDSDKNYFDLLKESESEQKEEEEKEKAAEEYSEPIEEKVEEEEPEQLNGKNLKSFLPKIGIIAVVLLFLTFFVNLFIPKEQTLYVSDKAWERSVEVEEYKTVREDGWSLPAGGRLAYTRDEIHHYDQVVDHYETKEVQKSERYISGYEKYVSGHRDLGNGYFEEITSERPVYDTRYWTETEQVPVYKDVPVYQTKYYYDIDKWVYKETETVNGTTKEPYWPELQLKNNERQGNKTEEYEIVTVNEKDKINTYEIDFNTWNKIEKGDSITAMVNAAGLSEIKDIN